MLVATENKKLIRKELGPAPLQPALAAAQPAGDGGVDELDRLLRVGEPPRRAVQACATGGPWRRPRVPLAQASDCEWMAL